MVYVLTDAAERDEFIQFVQNPTPGSKWDTFARKIPPNKTSKGRKKLKNSPKKPKKPKKDEGCKPSKNAKEEDSEDYDGIAGNDSHMKSTILKKRSKEGKKATASAKAGKDHKKKGKKSKANAMDNIFGDSCKI